MKNKRSSENSKILWNSEVAPFYFNMGLSAGDVYLDSIPGQFVMIHTGDRLSPLLRRPFSIHRVNKNGDGTSCTIEILYKVVGQSTKLFSELKEGDELKLLGPLGRGFDFSAESKRIFFAGGGIGIAPLMFLASELKMKGCDFSEAVCFIGGRNKNDVLCVETFEKMDLPVRISTDDGSSGEKGLITGLLMTAITEKKPDLIYACGPHPMLKAVSSLAIKKDIKCQLSIETMMACGMGACLGCAVEGKKDPSKFKHACIDGPVFDVEDIVL